MSYYDAVVKMLIAITTLLLDHTTSMNSEQRNALEDVRAVFIFKK